MNHKKHKYNNGIAPLIIIVVVLVAAVIGYLAYVMFYQIEDSGKYFMEDKMMYEEETSSPPPAEEPVSDSNDLNTIESELDATVTGSALEDIELMESEASSL